MTGFIPSFLHIESQELVAYLIKAAGQSERTQVNPQDLLDYLKLQYLSFDFKTELPREARESFLSGSPRAMISFHDRLVATDSGLSLTRTRFSVLHEIGHYILPNHQNTLYVCDSQGMSFRTHITFEQEANRVAADLLFLGDRFELESNSRPISAMTVKILANQFNSSFEAAAHRMAERHYRDCMLICFSRGAQDVVNSDAKPEWRIHYCVPSPSFGNKYFQRVSGGGVPDEVFQRISANGRNLEHSETEQVGIPCRSGSDPLLFNAEYFYNQYNVFCFLTPVDIRK
jgi:hypothetical protein